MTYTILIILGLCFGSFVNALVWRIHEQSLPKNKHNKKLSILKGRSVCVHCKHELAWYDLVPVLSWVTLKGKCRYCHKPISWQYPLVEIVTALLFLVSYLFWPKPLNVENWFSLGIWLVCVIGFVALTVYDLRWRLLPNRIVYFLLILSSIGVFVYAFLSGLGFVAIEEAFWGLLIGGGIFYLVFQISKGKWIGGGDVKLGFLLGLLVGGPIKALLMLFMASALGTLVALPLLASKRLKVKAQIPFGPFLIAGAIIVKLFGAAITAWYLKTFFPL